MRTKSIHALAPAPKKAYIAPKIVRVGHVKDLTMKIGSSTDGMGSFGG
ncbi:lasso RiPP family leader peptide-containing protein [Arundinibacter roseus]|uniref:Lasso RiPP family leader peptide-containing protein n=1 Tax=Arundinibacter roseus TaxID=2070510 RepID=A0A4R4KI20_9BACT|nr:lasso RiPP family leader peptide-containing protein [Arundinibacter roseus]TDB67503.1 lasso RiPP family leader peptide-containing protein [Arundinibacter roseus]